MESASWWKLKKFILGTDGTNSGVEMIFVNSIFAA